MWQKDIFGFCGIALIDRTSNPIRKQTASFQYCTIVSKDQFYQFPKTKPNPGSLPFTSMAIKTDFHAVYHHGTRDFVLQCKKEPFAMTLSPHLPKPGENLMDKELVGFLCVPSRKLRPEGLVSPELRPGLSAKLARQFSA